MSREIKFRAWDEKRGKYYYDIEKPCAPDYKAAFVIEQYTGLKDKNGVEIYERDIVKARWYRAKNARLDTKGEVRFNDGWFYIKDDPDGQDRLGVPIHDCYNIEVIGNIHENGGLLEEER